MSEAREFEDGAFYWVRFKGELTVAVFEAARPGLSANNLWRTLAEDGYFTGEDFDAIGSRIEPPAPANAA